MVEALRSCVHLSPAAYCACFVEAVEAMVGARGGVAYFPALIPLFGAGAFDDGGARLAAYLATGSATAVAFQESWGGMREEVAAGGVAGPLGLPAAMVGRDGAFRMQRALTQQREAVAQRRLHQDILALSPDDRVRQAYLGADRFSTQLITCVPTPARRSSDAEFREMFCTYMGLPSPCLQSHIGDQIPCGHGPRVCDGHGRQLDSSRAAVLASRVAAGTTSTTMWQRSCSRACSVLVCLVGGSLGTFSLGCCRSMLCGGGMVCAGVRHHPRCSAARCALLGG